MSYFYMYILKCYDGSYYIGHTDNIEQRISQHNQGKISGYTSKRRPVECVHISEFTTRDEAFQAERKIKGWTRAKKEALIREDWQFLIDYSKKQKMKKE